MKRLLVAGCLVLAGCGTPLHPKALEPSFARTFSGLYALQQHQDGRTGVRPDALGSTARCLRTGPDPDGPGEDWTCTVQYRDNATLFTQAFELQVKSDGCWRAEAPPLAQPAVREDPLTGAVLTNPLAEFDGCLDTSWR